MKRALGLVLLLIVQGVLFSFLEENRYSSRMLAVDWIRLGFSLAAAFLGVKLYQPVKTIATFHAVAFAKSRKRAWGEADVRHLVAATTDLLLLVFAIAIYVRLLPSIAQFSKAVLHVRALPQMLNIGLVVAGCGLLFKLWRNTQPLLDLLTNRISDTFSVSPARSTAALCPACKATNDSGSLFCISCGASLKRPSSAPAPTAPKSCPACGTENPLDAKFCHRCGKGL